MTTIQGLERILLCWPQGKELSVTDISEQLSISVSETFLLLNDFCYKGLIERWFEFMCPQDSCQFQFKGVKYINLPIEVTCNTCRNNYTTRDHLYVKYSKS